VIALRKQSSGWRGIQRFSSTSSNSQYTFSFRNLLSSAQVCYRPKRHRFTLSALPLQPPPPRPRLLVAVAAAALAPSLRQLRIVPLRKYRIAVRLFRRGALDKPKSDNNRPLWLLKHPRKRSTHLVWKVLSFTRDLVGYYRPSVVVDAWCGH